MPSKNFLNKINYDDEIKTCGITKPLEALKSDFSKKILNHISSKGKLAKWFVRNIMCKLEDESIKLTHDEATDFLNLIDVNQETFDLIVKRYQ
ncbi:MAG: hypothetical protein J0L86_16755 [Flavobacteriales bacterium]|nr:hypothetical protein [Flavobacteriales bacterium]